MTEQNETMILEAKELHKIFRAPSALHILKGVNLEVCGGESIAIMGRSGQGKSTLLQILGTLDRASSGSLSIGGLNVQHWNLSRIRRKKLAFVFQSYYLMEDYSVIENVMMPANIDRRDCSSGGESYRHALALLEKVGLADRAHSSAKLLSGGEKQRIAIARAFCNDPDLILADEPTGNLDAETASLIYKLLLEFAHQPGKALILVTHNEELANLCKRRLLLKDGILHPHA